MVKVFALIPRRTDLSREQFRAHWRDPHAGLATGIETINRYVQCHGIEAEASGLQSAPYDGIAEVWFDDLDKALAMGEHPVYVEKVQPDEANFIDGDRLAFMFTDEVTLLAGPEIERDADLVKVMVLAQRSPDVDVGEFGSMWHGSPAHTADELFPRLIRHVQSLAMPVNYAEGQQPPADGIDEMWWPDLASFQADWDEHAAAYLESLDAAVDRSASSGFVSEELRVVWP